MIYALILTSFVISIFLSAMIIPRILVVAFRKKLFDVPNDRKIHKDWIPRLGGMSFFPTILFSTAFTMAMRYAYGIEIPYDLMDLVVPEICFFICGLTLIYLTGVKDDLIGLRYRTKFFIQIVAASFLPLSDLWINNLYGVFGVYELTPWVGVPFTLFAVVFITNAINLIDGIDGLASGLSGMAVLVLGLLFLENQLWTYAILSFATLGVLLPFFYYNVFGKAERGRKIFMGDTGSLTLGYILSFLSIRYASYNPYLSPYADGAFVISFSVLLVPLLDVVRVIGVRARNRRSLFQPDKNHIHHKFLAMGFTPRASLLLILLMACSFCCVNMALMSCLDSNEILVGDILIWIGLNTWFDRVKARKKIRDGKKCG